MYDLSIIIPTCNRAALLDACLQSVARSITRPVEIVVVNGASTDQTNFVLLEHRARLGESLRVIQEPAREGFVRAANKGFRAARGRYLMWLNDDARPLPGALDRAVEQLDNAPPEVGLLALFHRTDTTRNVAYEATRLGRQYKLLHVRGTLYANFGLGRRSVFDRLGFFDERYYLNAADPDFSLTVWYAGLQVVPAYAALIDHDEHPDDRRAADSPRAREDNAALFAKWRLPPKNPTINDFDPIQPCTVRGLRDAAEALAATTMAA